MPGRAPAPEATPPLRSLAIPLLVLGIGLAFTLLLAAQLKRTIDEQDRARFESAADQLHDGIRDRIELYVAMLRAGTGLMAATDIATPGQFRTFVDRLRLEERYPGIQGIGYSTRVASAELAAFVAAQRQRIGPGFRVWPEGPRDEYHAILFLEPLDRRNQAAIGYDMFTEPTRRAAMARARDSGDAAATGIVTLVQEIDDDKQPGFLIYLPVYQGGATPATADGRRAALRGFVYSPFRIDDLFAGILGRTPQSRAGFRLYDGAAAPGTTPVFTSPGADDTGRFTSHREVHIAGRPLTAVMFSTRALDATSSVGLLPLATGSGLVLSLLFTAVALLQTRARGRAEASEAAAEAASRQFHQLANAVPQLAWMATADGWIYWYNERWYEYTGTTPAQMDGWGWQEVHDPAILPLVVERWKRSLATGEPFEMEFPLRAADGTYRWFLTRVAPFRDAGGTIRQWFGTNTDVQSRRDAERAVQEQAETLEVINRAGAQLAAELELERLVQSLTDTATRLTHAQFGAFFYNVLNEQGESYTLYTLSGVEREAFARFPMPRNTEVFGPTFRGEGVIRSDDITRDPRYGRNHPHRGMPPGHLPVRSYLAVPVKSRSGEVLGGLFFGHPDPAVFTAQAETIVVGLAAQAAVAMDNATLYRQVQRLLEQERQAREEAERVSRMKDEFLATLSHELRTPLNAVLGWGHMLVRGLLPADRRDAALESVLRNARIQSQLIDELLDMSRIISGRVRIDMARLELRATVDAALDVVRPTAAAKGVVLSVVDDGQPHPVWGDPDRLQQVIWNLLTNAVKFTDTGGGITIGLRRLASEVEVSVSDTGTGIAAEFLPHVFDRFRQADASTTRAHGGLGLGLSIAWSLVEMHAGRIRAESAGVGRGATFTVTLPLATEAEPPIPGDSAGVADASDAPARLSGLSILVVDDDADSRSLVAEVLRQHGAEVRTAASGREALDLVRVNRIRFAVVVSDIGMPGMDGYMFLSELRAVWPPSAPLRAIALTAYAGAEEEARAADAGYDHHVAKPFVPADLVHAVSRLATVAPDATKTT